QAALNQEQVPKAYRNAVLADSYFTHARYQLGLAYLRVKRFHDAWRQLNPLLAADPRNTRFRKLLAGVSRGAIDATRPPPDDRPPAQARPLMLPFPRQEGRIPLIRVGLGGNSAGKSLPRKEAFFRSSGGFAVVDADSGRILARGEGELWRARAVSGGKEARIEILDGAGKRKALSRRPLRVRPEEGQSVILRNVPADYGGGSGGGDRPLRGEIELSLHPSRRALRLVNVVDLESYTHGVLAAEMPIGSPIEALKAQAVVARTHALFIKIVTQRHKSDGYDVCDGQHCQVYNGVRNESERSRSIVDATRGRVVAFQGRIAHVLYSSNCAGHTQSGREVSGWGDVPYWTGVPDAPSTAPIPASPWELRSWLRRPPAAYCRASGYVHPSHFRWTRVVPAADLEERINRTHKIGKLAGLRTLQRSVSGHLNSVLIKGSRADRVVTQEIGIRALLGDGSQRSALFLVETETDKNGKPRLFTFFGGGWGHAVGMCQSGAMGRSEAGQSYADILAAYY
ncbi:MAG: SpoIID/LytB domain-containing protein, partial [Elusimicrobiota bacterium]